MNAIDLYVNLWMYVKYLKSFFELAFRWIPMWLWWLELMVEVGDYQMIMESDYDNVCDNGGNFSSSIMIIMKDIGYDGWWLLW